MVKQGILLFTTDRSKFSHRMKKGLKILAIESSCDETAASVIGEKDGNPVILSNIISSQIDLHAKTGGVVPEVASRAHMEAITPVITQSLLASQKSKVKSQKESIDYQEGIDILQNEITHIAVTAGPGLVGSLLVGFSAAKAIAFSRDLPIITINHIEGHIYSALNGVNSNFQFPISNQIPNSKLFSKSKIKEQYCNETIFPLLALTVSGGHTSLTLMKTHGDYEQIGATIDDAVGEAYDKVAKLMGLGYPGGPVVSEMAKIFREEIKSGKRNNELAPIVFPRPLINDKTLNFSFSGLKTAVLYTIRKIDDLTEKKKEEIAAAFEEAVKDVLVAKTLLAVRKYSPKAVIFAGGVSANAYLRESIDSAAAKEGVAFLTPKAGLFGDNAAMIGLAAYYHIKKGDVQTWQSASVDANLKLNN